MQEDAPASYTPSTYMVYVTAQNPLSMKLKTSSCGFPAEAQCDRGNALAAKPAMASLLRAQLSVAEGSEICFAKLQTVGINVAREFTCTASRQPGLRSGSKAIQQLPKPSFPRDARLIPACAQFCTSCELAGPRLCDEGKCIEGRGPSGHTEETKLESHVC